MPKLLLLVIAALGGAAIWRRREIRNDAERASKALAGAAGSARSRIRPNNGDDEVSDQQDGDDAVAGATAAADAADAAVSSN